MAEVPKIDPKKKPAKCTRLPRKRILPDWYSQIAVFSDRSLTKTVNLANNFVQNLPRDWRFRGDIVPAVFNEGRYIISVIYNKGYNNEQQGT